MAIGSALLGGVRYVGPDFKAPEPALPEHWRDSTVTSDAIEQMWWKQFHDATLDDLVTRALANNANVQLAMLRVAQSRVVRNADSGAFWPSVNAKAAYQRERQSEDGSSHPIDRPDRAPE